MPFFSFERSCTELYDIYLSNVSFLANAGIGAAKANALGIVFNFADFSLGSGDLTVSYFDITAKKMVIIEPLVNYLKTIRNFQRKNLVSELLSL